METKEVYVVLSRKYIIGKVSGMKVFDKEEFDTLEEADEYKSKILKEFSGVVEIYKSAKVDVKKAGYEINPRKPEKSSLKVYFEEKEKERAEIKR